jgi:hypothetical protein
MEEFIHDNGAPGHEGATGDVHAAGFDVAHGHADLPAEQALGSVSAANQLGNPNEYEHYWFYQEHNGYCVPSSITQVIEAQAGHTVHGYDDVVQETHALGIPVGANGMSLQDAQEILAHYDVPSHIVHPASHQQAIDALANYLEQGRNVILSVNASPIWYDGNQTYDNPSGGPDHALVVTAINDQTGVVTLSDPGSPDGNEEQVPLNVFMEAWNASDDQMLVTDHAAGTEDTQVWATVPHPAPANTAPGSSADNFVEKAGFVILPIALGRAVWRAVRK